MEKKQDQQGKEAEQKEEPNAEHLTLPIIQSDSGLEVKLAVDRGLNVQVLFSISF